jgi:protein-S-isoprenylcysteine O-methyltransferase Ste14
MKLLSDWGITSEWWRGDRGEYWVIAQGLLLFGFAILPISRPGFVDLRTSIWQYSSWVLASIFSVLAVIFLGRSLLDLGRNLTPLPRPRDDGQLVQTGIYGLVRHPLYSGLIYLALAYGSWQMSWTHWIGAIVLFVFFDAKARKEEAWLTEKFIEYVDYQNSVKKLIPWIY